jgi:hypothetical protein
MASTSALGPVAAAVLARLLGDTTLLAQLTSTDGTVRIVDDVPQAWLRSPVTYVPYLVVESGSERAFNTMGGPALLKWGSETTIRVRVVSQYRGDAEASSVLSLAKQRLDGQPLTVPGYGSASVDFVAATLLKDTIGGVTTRELVGDFDVTVHQS